MEEIAIDIMGPFPESSRGNKYVLVVVDSFSKWMQAWAIPNIEARTTAEVLVNQFISIFGVPASIKSDRGRQFECELFREMCQLLGADIHMSTPFHPQGNSRVERMVKVVGNLIAAYVQNYKDWDKDLSILTLAYRNTVHEVTRHTPSEVMLGFDPLLPLDLEMGGADHLEKKTVSQYVLDLRD